MLIQIPRQDKNKGQSKESLYGKTLLEQELRNPMFGIHTLTSTYSGAKNEGRVAGEQGRAKIEAILDSLEKSFVSWKEEQEVKDLEEAMKSRIDYSTWQKNLTQDISKDMTSEEKLLFLQEVKSLSQEQEDWARDFSSKAEQEYFNQKYQKGLDDYYNMITENLNNPKIIKQTEQQIQQAYKEYSARYQHDDREAQEYAKNQHKKRVEQIIENLALLKDRQAQKDKALKLIELFYKDDRITQARQKDNFLKELEYQEDRESLQAYFEYRKYMEEHNEESNLQIKKELSTSNISTKAQDFVLQALELEEASVDAQNNEILFELMRRVDKARRNKKNVCADTYILRAMKLGLVLEEIDELVQYIEESKQAGYISQTKLDNAYRFAFGNDSVMNIDFKDYILDLLYGASTVNQDDINKIALDFKDIYSSGIDSL